MQEKWQLFFAVEFQLMTVEKVMKVEISQFDKHHVNNS
jgi:hypothetical protein